MDAALQQRLSLYNDYARLRLLSMHYRGNTKRQEAILMVEVDGETKTRTALVHRQLSWPGLSR